MGQGRADKGNRRIDTQATSRGLAAGGDFLQGFAAVQDLTRLGQYSRAFWRDFDRPRGAPQQSDPKLFFQPCDRAAQG